MFENGKYLIVAREYGEMGRRQSPKTVGSFVIENGKVVEALDAADGLLPLGPIDQKVSARIAHLSNHGYYAIIPPSARSGLMHFDKTKEVASVAVKRGNYLLMGRRQDSGGWTLPGGRMKYGEYPDVGGARELFEETGLETKAAELEYLGSEKIVCEDGVERIIHSFLSKSAQGKPTTENDPDHEVLRWQWVDVSNGLPPEIAAKLHSKHNVTLKFLGLQNWT